MARRFAAVWPDAVMPEPEPEQRPGPAPTRWPDTSGHRPVEAAWQALDGQVPISTGAASAAGSPSPIKDVPLPPGRAALGSFDPGRRGIRVLAVVAVLVVLVAGYLAWRSRPSAEPVPAAPAASVAASGTAPPSGLVVVAVQGRVTHPGLYRLPSGSRVADALAAAGGVLPGVDLSFVNLARRLTDGELILVGATPPPGQAGPAPGGRVDLNTATLTQLDALPGVGPALAQRLLDYRTQHGGFHSVDDLRRVSGIGDAKFAQLKDLVTV